jgi:hypothetical protein
VEPADRETQARVGLKRNKDVSNEIVVYFGLTKNIFEYVTRLTTANSKGDRGERAVPRCRSTRTAHTHNKSTQFCVQRGWSQTNRTYYSS